MGMYDSLQDVRWFYEIPYVQPPVGNQAFNVTFTKFTLIIVKEICDGNHHKAGVDSIQEAC